MGSLYRSELMSLYQILSPADVVFDATAELGELGLCQFRDLNADFTSYQRIFANEVKRCEELGRKLASLRSVIEEAEIDIKEIYEYPPTPSIHEFSGLEAQLDTVYDEIESNNASANALKDNFVRLYQIEQVLRRVRTLLDEGQRRQAYASISEQQHLHARPNGDVAVAVDEVVRTESELKFVSGTIDTVKVRAFERALWRFCSGNVFARTYDMEKPEHRYVNTEENHSVFILFFSGEQLRSKVIRICDAFRANVVDCPDNEAQRSEYLISVHGKLEDMNRVLNQTFEHRDTVLENAATKLTTWEILVLKIKSVFHTLNLMTNKIELQKNEEANSQFFIGEVWLPDADVSNVRVALEVARLRCGSTVSCVLNRVATDETPPTFNRTNKFTRAFQNIVDAYGTANYREINPAPWTITTFPFIFAIMFGDLGHGFIMFLSALMLIIFESRIERLKIKDEIFNTFYGGRYVIILMGAFSIYTGLIYNDVFSRAIGIFDSHWRNPYEVKLLENATVVEIQNTQESSSSSWQLNPQYAFLDKTGPYPFGVDPVWNVADNRLNFLNPLKMKMSVIIGISQMMFGLLLSLGNYIHKRSVVDVVLVFIPQLLFLTLLFVYLCVLIVLKWVFFYVRPSIIFGYLYPGSNCAPSLLIGFINMFMMKSRDYGFVEPINDNGEYKDIPQCSQTFWYPNQSTIETAFLIVAVLCIPIMLFGKPIALLIKVKKGLPVEVHSEDGHGVFNFADVMVYQAIHTIEFALGCISHTASYLRLWALSLAHAQLSEVLWTMALRQGFQYKGIVGGIILTVVFFAFAFLTVAILILMEGLSAFLHALRLHWVEFQSKFYGGTGIPFEPFSFTRLIRVYEGLED